MSNTIPLVSLSGTTLFTFTYNSYDETIINSLRDCIQKHYKYYYVIINDEKIIYYNLHIEKISIDIKNIDYIRIIIIDDELGKIIDELLKRKSYSIKLNNLDKTMLEHILNNKDILILILKFDFRILELVSETIINDEEFIKKLVKQNGAIYIYDKIQKYYKNNKTILLEALKSKLHMYPRYSERYNYCILPKYIDILEYCDINMKNDFDIVLEAVKNNGLSLQFASIELQNNYTIVLEAIKQNSFALQFASIELQNNYTIVYKAVQKNNNSIRYAGLTLIEHPNIKNLIECNNNSSND